MRDTNHDGRFTAADGIHRRGAGTSMLFHQGGNSMTGSAGCQTMNPGDYAAFLGLVAGQGSFSYVLVR